MTVATRKPNTGGRTNGPSRFRKVKRLNEEARKQVDDNADKLAKALFDQAIGGGVMSARLLLELAEGNVEAEEALTRRPLASLAESLAAEKPFPAPAEEHASETGSGGREPE